ncbi:MAG: alanine racemase C-terminal domain-containing protein [Caldilineaceae bacterium]
MPPTPPPSSPCPRPTCRWCAAASRSTAWTLTWTRRRCRPASRPCSRGRRWWPRCATSRPATRSATAAKFIADRPMTVAVLPLGYADGFPRKPLNWGSVLIRGRSAPILGRVCMDQTIVDVTAIVAATGPLAMGDEAVLIGRQGDAELSAAEAARRTGTINYDVTSRILARVPRMLKNRIEE